MVSLATRMWCAGLLIVGAATLAPQIAHAQVKEFDIQFRVDPAYAPTRICAQIEAPLSMEFMGANKPPPLTEIDGASDNYRPLNTILKESLKKPTAEAQSVEAAFSALRRSYLPFQSLPGTIDGLWEPVIQFGLTEKNGDAPPDFDKHARIVCKDVERTHGVDERIAVIWFRMQKVPAPLLKVRAVGRMLRISMRGAGPTDEAIVQSIGGSYHVEDGPVLTSNGEAMLDLRPRLEIRPVRIKGAPDGCASVVATAGPARRWEQAVPVQNGSFLLPIPNLGGGPDAVRVRVSTFDAIPQKSCAESIFDSSKVTMRLDGTFSGKEAAFEPGVTFFRFATLRSCELPADRECPTARVASTGEPCVLTEGDERCAYSCGLRGAVTMPVDIKLTLGNQDFPSASWVEHIALANQSLCTAPTDIGINLSLKEWPSKEDGARRKDLGDGISYLDILGVSGDVYRVRPYDQLPPLRIPNAGSGAQLRYRLVGDRKYSEDAQPVRRGVLGIKAPNTLDTQVEIAMGAGIGYGGTRSALRPQGTALVAVRYLPWSADWYIEWRVNLVCTEQMYIPFSGAAQQMSSVVPFVRILPEAVFFWRLARRFQLGVAGGLAIGFAYQNSDTVRVGGASVRPEVGAIPRLPITEWAAAEFFGRLFLEPFHAFEQPLGDHTQAFRGNPVDQVSTTLHRELGSMLVFRM